MQIGTEEWNSVIREGAKAFGTDADEYQLRQFGIHAAELLYWNQKINLTAITDPLEIAVKHFMDSIIPVAMIPPQAAMLDIGSGGGFPGLPIQVMLPTIHALLIDASKKKVSFMNHVIGKLGIQSAAARHIRAEDLAKEGKHHFDVIISRALSDLKTFVSLALPLLSENGMMIALKGEICKSETDQVFEFMANSDQFSSKGIKHFNIRTQNYQLPHIHQKGTVFIMHIYGA